MTRPEVDHGAKVSDVGVVTVSLTDRKADVTGTVDVRRVSRWNDELGPCGLLLRATLPRHGDSGHAVAAEKSCDDVLEDEKFLGRGVRRDKEANRQ